MSIRAKEESNGIPSTNQGHFIAKLRHGHVGLHLSGAPTHLPQSHPFCSQRAYLPKALPEVMSEAESFTVQICAHSTLRVSTLTFFQTKSLYAHLNSIYAMTTMFHDMDLDPSLSSSSSNTFVIQMTLGSAC